MTVIKALEAKRTLFDSVEKMLRPRTFSQLVQKPVADVHVIALGDNGGLSGSRLEEYLNYRFDDMEWHAMIELGGLAGAVTMMCFPVLFHTITDDPEER